MKNTYRGKKISLTELSKRVKINHKNKKIKTAKYWYRIYKTHGGKRTYFNVVGGW